MMRFSANPSSRSLGFTLLEVLVSISVFSMVAIISYSTLDTYIDQRERLKLHYGKLEQVQRLFILLERDIQFMIRRSVRVGGDVEPAVKSEDGNAFISMTVAEADFRGSSGVALKRIQWRLDGGEMIRSEWDVLDRNDQLEPIELVMSDEIEDIELNYLMYSRAQGLDSKSSLAPDEFPDGVEVQIKLKSGESYRRVFATAIGDS